MILPNEIRVSTKGTVDSYLGACLYKLKEGFEHIKVVGRGNAVEPTEELLALLKQRQP